MNSLKSRTIRWNPQLICDCGFNKYVLVILNRRIEFEKEFMISLWNKDSFFAAHKKILVDGGANHWFEFLKKHNLSNADKRNIPDFITGDLDSVTQVVLNSFELLGTKIVRTPDQDETDFTKALHVLAEQSQIISHTFQVEAVVTLAETCGRFDQIMANINTLYKAKNIFSAPVYLLSKESITWILWTGEHEIEIKLRENSGNKWCSLIPIGRRCNKVTTSGLKWNLA
ncbi:hypothetical protein J437_LFUL006365 [Ladona fulva]|uniref:Thiamine diphosphokinase n=1 Tax=Ladona fulva TaxID=123851 RepID=A0A8K0K128_LADFU|nr:hypothetical protein J437_LFUL006365 [Ladona fulva]